MTGVAPDLPIWAQWFAALAVPIAAIVGIALGFLNYRLQRKKRRDDLFDRRFELYEKFREFCYQNVYELDGGGLHELPAGMYIKMIEPWIYRVDLIFGPELSKQLRSIDREKFFYPNNNPLVLENQLHSLFAPFLRFSE